MNISHKMHVTFDPDRIDWSEYLTQPSNQIGSGFGLQHGFGNYFVGMPYQRGTGIGSIFRSLFRVLKPLGKHLGPLAEVIGREGLATTSRVLNNVLEGEKIGDAVKKEARVGIGNLLNKASDHLQKGQGNRRRRGRPRKTIKEKENHKDLILVSRLGPRAKKPKVRVDSLGYY